MPCIRLPARYQQHFAQLSVENTQKYLTRHEKSKEERPIRCESKGNTFAWPRLRCTPTIVLCASPSIGRCSCCCSGHLRVVRRFFAFSTHRQKENKNNALIMGVRSIKRFFGQ